MPDPGSLPFFHPGSWSQKKDPASAFLTQKIACKLSEKLSGMFIPDPNFLPIPDPGYRYKGEKAPDPDPQHRYVSPLSTSL
jgi:hypothetical protein